MKDIRNREQYVDDDALTVNAHSRSTSNDSNEHLKQLTINFVNEISRNKSRRNQIK